MANDCFTGDWWYKEVDEEGTYTDINGATLTTWMDWTDHMGQAIDDQMCLMQEAFTSQMEALSGEIDDIPAPSAPTKTQVQSALGAPAAALTPAGGTTIATVQVLGLTVLAGSSVTALENAITRVGEIEARLKTLGLLN